LSSSGVLRKRAHVREGMAPPATMVYDGTGLGDRRRGARGDASTGGLSDSTMAETNAVRDRGARRTHRGLRQFLAPGREVFAAEAGSQKEPVLSTCRNEPWPRRLVWVIGVALGAMTMAGCVLSEVEAAELVDGRPAAERDESARTGNLFYRSLTVER